MKIDRYFLTEDCIYSRKLRLRGGRIKVLCAVIGLVTVIALLFAGKVAEKVEADTVASAKQSLETAARPAQAAAVNHYSGQAGDFLGPRTTIAPPPSASSSRQYTASQIVGHASGLGLPVGTTFSVRLAGRLVSTDQASPAIAMVSADVLGRSQVMIPEGSRLLGSASFDGTGDRLQIRFNTVVDTNGIQHQISGLALLKDGSSGLTGTFHSDALKHQAGSFASYFLGGLAEGLEDRQQIGQTGITFEPGSLRNGVLNGVAASSIAEGKAFSDSALKVHPRLEVEAGEEFLVYLEKEFTP